MARAAARFLHRGALVQFAPRVQTFGRGNKQITLFFGADEISARDATSSHTGFQQLRQTHSSHLQAFLEPVHSAAATFTPLSKPPEGGNLPAVGVVEAELEPASSSA